MIEPFVYRARLTHIVDGDTFDVILDCGFGLHIGLDPLIPMRLRLLGVDAREKKSKDPAIRVLARADTLLTTQWLASTAPWPLLVRTSRDDVFGRYLAVVYRSPDPNELSLNEYLLAQGVPVYVP